MVCNAPNARKALQSVEEQRAEVGRLRRVVKRLHSASKSTTSRLGSGGGRPTYGRQEVWDVLVDQSLQLEREEKKLRELEDRLEDWIELLPKHRWRMVLRCHYFDGLPLSEVAVELSKSTGRNFTAAQIYRLHGQALMAAENLWPMS